METCPYDVIEHERPSQEPNWRRQWVLDADTKWVERGPLEAATSSGDWPPGVARPFAPTMRDELSQLVAQMAELEKDQAAVEVKYSSLRFWELQCMYAWCVCALPSR